MTRALIVLAALSVVASSAYAAPGDLDPSFGGDGTVVLSLSAERERAYAVAIQSDGRILLGGVRTNIDNTASSFLLVRLDAGGAPDPSFGTGGAVVTSLPGVHMTLLSVLPQADGKIVAVGMGSAMGTSIILARYDSDGSLDPTFGTGGLVSSVLGPGQGSVMGAMLQNDGRIIVAGNSYATSPFRSALARFNPDGSADPTFGSGGEVLSDLGPSHDGIGLQPDGRILVVGRAGSNGGVARYLTDGSLDASFGTGGIAIAADPLYPNEVVVQADGGIVVGGASPDGPTGTDLNFKVRRFNDDGTPDASFAGGGVTTIGIGSLDDQPLGMVVQPNGRIVLGGYTTVTTNFAAQFALAAVNADGTLDATFGVGGIVTTQVAGFARDFAYALAMQPDGRLVLAGDRFFPPLSAFAVARYFGNVCGEGTVEPGETCDDGNALDGDCCSSACEYDPAGTPCPDGDPCTTDTCDGAGACTYAGCALCQVCAAGVGCVGQPRSDCAAADGADLMVRDHAADRGDLVRWRWRSRVPAGTVGDPTTADDYALCLYSGAGENLWLARSAPAAGVCDGEPCWEGLGAPPLSSGALYDDPARTPDGIGRMVLRLDPQRPARLALRGKGTELALPPFGALALPLRAQLQRGDACWDASFTTPRVNTDGLFKAGR